MPRGIAVHKLTELDLEAKKATCAKCGPNSDIRIKSGKPRCRESIRENVRARRNYVHRDKRAGRHGLTVVEAKELRENSSCNICGSTEDLKVDHAHDSGILRGVLCHKHNLALGLFSDNTAHLLAAIQYLENPPGVNIGNN